jgi:hypothetical protein
LSSSRARSSGGRRASLSPYLRLYAGARRGRRQAPGAPC